MCANNTTFLVSPCLLQEGKDEKPEEESEETETHEEEIAPKVEEIAPKEEEIAPKAEEIAAKEEEIPTKEVELPSKEVELPSKDEEEEEEELQSLQVPSNINDLYEDYLNEQVCCFTSLLCLYCVHYTGVYICNEVSLKLTDIRCT